MDVTHYAQQFNSAVIALAGGPDRSFLKEAIGFKSGVKGETDWLDAISPTGTAGAVTKVTSLTNRETYDKLASESQTAENFIAHNFTRNDSVNKFRTPIEPYEIDVSKWFAPQPAKFLELTDPTNRTLKALMSDFWYKIDQRIALALLKSSVTRKSTDNSTLHAITMPTGQILPDVTYKTADFKQFAAIKKRFQKAYVAGQPIIWGMGPDYWEALINNSGDKLLNKDYVSSAAPFDSGELPKVFGITPLVHPIFEDTATLSALGLLAEGEVALTAAWTQNGVIWDEWEGVMTDMSGPNPFMKRQSVALIHTDAEAERIDDRLVVQGAVIADAT